MILSADLGGTKCNVILFAAEAAHLRPVCRWQVATNEFSTIESFLQDCLKRARHRGRRLNPGEITSAGFGIAGAVVGDEVVCNNLAWHITGKKIADTLAIPRQNILLLNDVEAAASSLAHLEDADLLPLNDALAKARAPKVYIAAGTGLGESILFWNGERYQVSAAEAGLTDFAPGTQDEITLLRYLWQRMPRVCTEEVVSGRGFRAIHEALFPDVRHAFFDDPSMDSARNITEQAFAKTCPACDQTLHLWVQIYGSEAGNMALRTLPFGGVYIGGGIALKILPKLKDGTFVRAFSNKTKLGEELARIPIYIVLNQDAPVLGAAYGAFERSGRHAGLLQGASSPG